MSGRARRRVDKRAKTAITRFVFAEARRRGLGARYLELDAA
jgi:hypothetical protein